MGYGKMNNLNILYEDNHIIVVEKIPGILSQSDVSGDEDLLTNIKKYIKEKYKKEGNVYVGLVHRLDRNVGGIMVFAKTSKAAKRLNEQIKKHEFNKTYLALTNGIISNKKDKLENYLYKDELKKQAFITNDKTKGKEAILEYEVIDYIKSNTLLKINLITGRFHQIRAQLSNIDHPIIGDIKYGKIKSNLLYLYAYKLEFIHPVKKDKMTFKILPKWEEINNETIIHRL